MSRFMYLVLGLLFGITACQGGISRSGATYAVQSNVPSSTLTIERTRVPETPSFPPQKAMKPIFTYVEGNMLVKQISTGESATIARLPCDRVYATVSINNSLFVLDERGIVNVNVATSSYEDLITFDIPILSGQLFLYDNGTKIAYAVVFQDINTQSSFATIVGGVDLIQETEIFESYYPNRLNLLGVTGNGKSIVLQPLGQDPEFDAIWLLDISQTNLLHKIPLQQIGVGNAWLSPNGEFLVILGQSFTEQETGQSSPDLETVFSLYSLSSLDMLARHDFALPNAPSHIREVLWSANSEKAYFLLLAGNIWDEPSRSYGLWSLNTQTNEMSLVASLSDIDLMLSKVYGEYLLLAHQSKDEVVLVHVPTSETWLFYIPKGALIVDMVVP